MEDKAVWLVLGVGVGVGVAAAAVVLMRQGNFVGPQINQTHVTRDEHGRIVNVETVTGLGLGGGTFPENQARMIESGA